MWTKVTLFHKRSRVAKKNRSMELGGGSAVHNLTVAHKAINVYNIYMKPKGNAIDAMAQSHSWGGSLGRVRTRRTGESAESK